MAKDAVILEHINKLIGHGYTCDFESTDDKSIVKTMIFDVTFHFCIYVSLLHIYQT